MSFYQKILQNMNEQVAEGYELFQDYPKHFVLCPVC